MVDTTVSEIVRGALAEVRRTLVWPVWLIPDTAADRWLKAKCEKRAARRWRSWPWSAGSSS